MSLKLDTGAAISVINVSTYKTILTQQPPLEKSIVKLHTYSGEQLTVLGELQVTVHYNGHTVTLSLIIVVQGLGQNLSVRTGWSRLKWTDLNYAQSNIPVHSKKFLTNTKQIFVINWKGPKELSIEISADDQPWFIKPRPLPFTLKSKVKDGLDKLQSDSVRSPVTFLEWVALIIP